MPLRIGVFKYIGQTLKNIFMTAERCKTSWPLKELTNTTTGNGADVLEHSAIVKLVSQSRCSWPLPATYERTSIAIGYNANATPSDFVTLLPRC